VKVNPPSGQTLSNDLVVHFARKEKWEDVVIY
jgi:hypothetical protein